MKSYGKGSKETKIIPTPMKINNHFSLWIIKRLVSLSQFIGLFYIAHGLDKDIRQIYPNLIWGLISIQSKINQSLDVSIYLSSCRVLAKSVGKLPNSACPRSKIRYDYGLSLCILISICKLLSKRSWYELGFCLNILRAIYTWEA